MWEKGTFCLAKVCLVQLVIMMMEGREIDCREVGGRYLVGVKGFGEYGGGNRRLSIIMTNVRCLNVK